MKLLLNNSAQNWLDALPLGNGHMGAMVFGGEAGKYQLTENTFWSGREREKSIPLQARTTMDKVREHLRMGENNAAQQEYFNNYVCDEAAFGTQLPLADLLISIDHKAKSITRELSLASGVVHEQLMYDSLITRTSFASHPAKLFCICMQSDSIMPNISISLNAHRITYAHANGNNIELACEAREGLHSDFSCGVDAICALQVHTDGTATSNKKTTILITNAKKLEIYIAVKTSFECDNPKKICSQYLSNASQGFDILLKSHVQDFSNNMQKCTLSLGNNSQDTITSDAIAQYKKDGTNLLIEQALFQMGRYMLLITSRQDSLVPAALQGVINDNLACNMPWANDVHININTQMNYTPAEATGLSACTMPLFKYIKDRLAIDGSITAKELYNARGWVANTVTNLFGFAPPRSNEYWWALSHTCGGWLATHIWEHYLYTQDIDFLQDHFNVLLFSAIFMLDMMEPHPKTGELVANPSYSPENSFYLNGTRTSLCIGSTFDRNVAVAMFNIVIKAARALNIKDNSMVNELTYALTKIPPLRKGAQGQLMEWYEEYEETDPTHRHTSQLLCLYPFKEISKHHNPNALAWAAKSLEQRCANEEKFISVTWCGAQVTSHYAMLHNGERAGHIHRIAAQKIVAPNLLLPHGDVGIYEMDGNTGYTSAVVDMLMQSDEAYIELLPALPTYWHEGCINSLTAVGNINVCIHWHNDTLSSATLCSRADCYKTIIYKNKQIKISLKRDELFTLALCDI